MWGYPPGNAMEEQQDRTERMLWREDQELAEQIARERFGEHEEETDDGHRK